MKTTNLLKEISNNYKSFISLEESEIFKEANLLDLYSKAKREDALTGIDKNGEGRLDRGKSLNGKVRYFGLSNDGTLNFKVSSGTRAGKFHYVFLETNEVDFDTYYGDAILIDRQHLQAKDLNILIQKSRNFRIGCTCEDFLYHAFQYMATQGDYEAKDFIETRAPKRNNTGLYGAFCKHIIAVIENISTNTTMRNQIVKDIENYILYSNDMDYEEFQTQKAANMVKQRKHSSKFKKQPSDYCNEYFARLAKSHPFLDDKDIKHSLKMAMNTYIHNNEDASINGFLKDFFKMTEDAFADEMKIPVDSVEDYFNELGFTSKTEKMKQQVNNILSKDVPDSSGDTSEDINDENIEPEEDNRANIVNNNDNNANILNRGGD